jgi:hypothetical protein
MHVQIGQDVGALHDTGGTQVFMDVTGRWPPGQPSPSYDAAVWGKPETRQQAVQWPAECLNGKQHGASATDWPAHEPTYGRSWLCRW